MFQRNVLARFVITNDDDDDYEKGLTYKYKLKLLL